MEESLFGWWREGQGRWYSGVFGWARDDDRPCPSSATESPHVLTIYQTYILPGNPPHISY